ncbi:mitochondrial fusion and transport protein-like protein Ugo1 [Macrophomina phaseolina]|uniref:Mitochondrial fusion and transport protein-like protein Ugo1 n=1 Tax=Macrophomina phaseolina TaxID=35725 RepID=A0ABQ8GFD0_9PEZI|nr:mitochondrial fusion and transport protein-like protein Ugo1 [Macrophomina phaseolina]
MATSRDQPNPLRPYYIPPSIGLPNDPVPTAAPRLSPSAKPSASSPKPSFGSQARDILNDLDYGVDLSLGDGSPTVAEMAKKLLDQAVWNYTSVLFAQPFEVAKTVLQLHSPRLEEQSGRLDPDDARKRAAAAARARYAEFSDSDSGDDSASYFSSTAPRSNLSPASPSDSRSPRRRSTARNAPPKPTLKHPYKLDLKRSDSLLEVLSQLWTKEGAWGVWKGTNSTFVYNFLLKTIETWMRSLLSALLNVPDPGLLGGYGVGGGGLDIVDSPNPITSLAVAVAAAGITGLVLAPLDMVRTRLLVTPHTISPRAILPNLRSLPTLTVPGSLLPITLLHSTIPTFISASTPIFLRSSLHIDPVLTPATYSICTFLSSATELFVKLPLETVLRRGQAAMLTEHAARQANFSAHTTFRSSSSSRPSRSRSPTKRTTLDPEPLPTVVDIGPYRGLLGTMWYIVREEGSTGPGPGAPPVARTTPAGVVRYQQQKVNKGQGVPGLVRGWRVGFWGLVGVWGAAMMGGSGGGEF